MDGWMDEMSEPYLYVALIEINQLNHLYMWILVISPITLLMT